MKTFSFIWVAVCMLPSFSVATRVAQYPNVFQTESAAQASLVRNADTPPEFAGVQCANCVCSRHPASPNQVPPMLPAAIVTSDHQVWSRSYSTFPPDPLPVSAGQPLVPRRLQLVPRAGPTVHYKSVPTVVTRPTRIRKRELSSIMATRISVGISPRQRESLAGSGR